MHRPTRKHRHLASKTERKLARSRVIGKKSKRWKKWIDTYKVLNHDNQQDDDKSDES